MSNVNKGSLLGLNFSTASQRLRKLIMFDLVQHLELDQCFQCGGKIEDVDDLSVEHKEPWQGADDPKAAFFDLNNIAFSHLRCNSGAAAVSGAAVRRTHCLAGHDYSDDNVYTSNDGNRRCRECRRIRDRRWNRTATRRQYQRDYQRTRYHSDPEFAEYHRQKNKKYRSRSRSSIG